MVTHSYKKGVTTIETTIRRNTQTDFSTSKENVSPKNNRKTAKNSMNIIEQLYQEICESDWVKYFETIKEEEKC